MSHTPTVTVAKNAGFCFGVARATKAVSATHSVSMILLLSITYN